jgi:hypothetical protein
MFGSPTDGGRNRCVPESALMADSAQVSRAAAHCGRTEETIVSDAFQPIDYLRNCISDLGRSSKQVPLKVTWSVVVEGLIPTLSAEDKCESIIPVNIEIGGSAQSTANQAKVKPAGKVTPALAHIFQDRLVFLRWSGTRRIEYELTTVRYDDVRAVNAMDFRYRMNTIPGFEILTTRGRIPVLGNDPYKFDKNLIARWNNRIMKRLTGEWQPQWAEDQARVERWSAPAAT